MIANNGRQTDELIIEQSKKSSRKRMPLNLKVFPFRYKLQVVTKSNFNYCPEIDHG